MKLQQVKTKPMCLTLQSSEQLESTKGALILAKELCSSWKKVAVISSSQIVKTHPEFGNFQILEMPTSASRKEYLEALNYCVEKEMEVIILDAMPYEWSAIMEIASRFSSTPEKVPAGNVYVNAILNASCHVIATIALKQDYSLFEGEGKVASKDLEEEKAFLNKIEGTQSMLELMNLYVEHPEFRVSHRANYVAQKRKLASKLTEVGFLKSKKESDDFESL